MKSVTFLTKLRRLIKSLAVSIVFLVLGVIGSSFSTVFSENDGLKKSARDSAFTDKNAFPSLFETNNDPFKPGVFQLNSKAKVFVEKFISQNSDRLNRMKVWGKPYFDIYDGVLVQYGLPVELKYLSVIESSLKQGALSPMGAGGPWQIMPTEARRLGLKVNSKVDERKNYYKSTHAAAKFMKELHAQFNDWLLVIAAYNCGPGRLRQAIRKSGSKDFWALQKFLPLETRNHVKKFIGTHYVFEGTGGLTTMTANEMNQYNLAASLAQSKETFNSQAGKNTIAAEVKGKYHSKVISKNLGIDLEDFKRLNPEFDKKILKNGSYTMRLPVDKMMKFDHSKKAILDKSVAYLLN